MNLLKFLYIFIILVIAASSHANIVDEIVVTGTKNKSQILDISGNISFVDIEEIKFISPHNPSEVLNRTPGVFVSMGSGQEHLTSIRSPILSGGAGAGSFLYLEDGIPLRSPGFANVNGLMDSIIEISERTEIIRGPGSVLYGSNAIHGLINVITEKDGTEDSNTLNLNLMKHEFTFDSNIYRNLSNSNLLFNFFWREDNGHSHNHDKEDHDLHGDTDKKDFDQPHYGQQKFLLRWDTSKNSKDYIFSISGTNLNQETMGYIKGYQAYKDESKRHMNPDPEAFRDAFNIRSHFKIVQQLENASLSLTPYIRYTEMDFRMHFLPGKPLEKNSHKSIGLQTLYQRPFNNHFLTIGIDTEVTEGELSENQTAPDVSFGPRLAYPNGIHYDYKIDSTILAAFVNIEWQISKDTILVTGIRGENVEYDYKTNTAPGIRGRIQVSPNRTDDFTDFSPKFAINHKLNEKLAIFANYSRGNRAPQTTDLYRIQSKQVPGGAESEKMDSFEIGLRGSFQNLSLELVGFNMKKENYFFRDSQGFNVENGKTTHEGFEIGYILGIADILQIEGSASYAEHKYDFNHTPNGIKSGYQIDSAPELLANTRLIFVPKDGVRFELEWEKIDSYPVDEGNTHFYKGHNVFNLRGKWPINENFNVGFLVNNLTDEEYATRADYAFGNYRYFVGHQRMFNLMLEAKF